MPEGIPCPKSRVVPLAGEIGEARVKQILERIGVLVGCCRAVGRRRGAGGVYLGYVGGNRNRGRVRGDSQNNGGRKSWRGTEGSRHRWLGILSRRYDQTNTSVARRYQRTSSTGTDDWLWFFLVSVEDLNEEITVTGEGTASLRWSPLCL